MWYKAKKISREKYLVKCVTYIGPPQAVVLLAVAEGHAGPRPKGWAPGHELGLLKWACSTVQGLYTLTTIYVDLVGRGQGILGGGRHVRQGTGDTRSFAVGMRL